jgi:hypothetical protein
MSARLTSLLLDTLRLLESSDRERLAAAWHAVDPKGLSGLLDYEGTALWLYRRLADRGILNMVDKTFATELTKHARSITAYNLRVDAQRDSVIRTLAAARIPHLLLKGCALRLAAARFPYADARLTTDVDILVPPDSVEAAWNRLREAGFEVTTADQQKYKEHHHLPPLTDARGVSVEFHRSISRRIQPSDAWERMAAGAAHVSRGGGSTFLPTHTELLWHAISHAATDSPHGFRLRFFLDAAVIISAAPKLDWDTIRQRLGTDELEDPATARRWLSVAQWLGGSRDTPDWLPPFPDFDLHRMLCWRQMVTASLARYRARETHGRDVPQVMQRLSRLLMEEGVRSELELSPTPPDAGRTAAARAGRRIAARGARLLYLGWRSLRGQPRSNPFAPSPRRKREV